MKKTLIGLSGLFLSACGMMGNGNTAMNTANVNANTANMTAANVTANAVNTAANVNVNAANIVKPVDKGPKRINFGKGQRSAAENMVLVPGESRKFVVSAKAGQFMTIASSAKEAEVKMLSKGKSTIEEVEDGSLTATLDKGGDFIFEVKNPTKKEFKTSVNVTIDTESEY